MLRRRALRHGHGWNAKLHQITPCANVYGLKPRKTLVTASVVKINTDHEDLGKKKMYSTLD